MHTILVNPDRISFIERYEGRRYPDMTADDPPPQSSDQASCMTITRSSKDSNLAFCRSTQVGGTDYVIYDHKEAPHTVQVNSLMKGANIGESFLSFKTDVNQELTCFQEFSPINTDQSDLLKSKSKIRLTAFVNSVAPASSNSATQKSDTKGVNPNEYTANATILRKIETDNYLELACDCFEVQVTVNNRPLKMVMVVPAEVTDFKGNTCWDDMQPGKVLKFDFALHGRIVK